MFTFSVSCLFLIAAWANTQASCHQHLSSATLSEALATTAKGFGLSLLPSIRLALADAVGERLSLRREAVRYRPEPGRRQALALSALAPFPHSQDPVERWLADDSPPIKIVIPQASASFQQRSAKPQQRRTNKPLFVRVGVNSPPFASLAGSKIPCKSNTTGGKPEGSGQLSDSPFPGLLSGWQDAWPGKGKASRVVRQGLDPLFPRRISSYVYECSRERFPYEDA